MVELFRPGKCEKMEHLRLERTSEKLHQDMHAALSTPFDRRN